MLYTESLPGALPQLTLPNMHLGHILLEHGGVGLDWRKHTTASPDTFPCKQCGCYKWFEHGAE